MEKKIRLLLPYGTVILKIKKAEYKIKREILNNRKKLDEATSKKLIAGYKSLNNMNYLKEETIKELDKKNEVKLTQLEIDNYIELITSALPKNQTVNFIKNIQMLKVQLNLSDRNNIGPHYDIKTNTVNISSYNHMLNDVQNKSYFNKIAPKEYRPFFNEIILHELTHVASSTRANNEINTGLITYEFDTTINEAFTHFLTNTIYPEQSLENNRKFLVYKLVLQLTTIVGYEKMLGLYLNASGSSEMDKLLSSFNNDINLNDLKYNIYSLEELSINSLSEKNINNLAPYLIRVQNLLIKTYLNKIDHLLDNNVDKKIINEDINRFKSSLITHSDSMYFQLDAVLRKEKCEIINFLGELEKKKLK